MAGQSEELTVAELERILARRKQELATLLDKREQLQKELDDVTHRILDLQGGTTIPKASGAPRVSTRGRNAVSLRHTVIRLLDQHKEGYSLADLSDRIIESGYKTSSKNFRNVLYQCLYNTPQVFHDSKTGTYRLSPKGNAKGE